MRFMFITFYRTQTKLQRRVSTYNRLLSHSRFLVDLRSQEGKYHSLILFRLSPSQSNEDKDSERQIGGRDDPQQIYAMEANCPHLGADLSHAEIEECETGLVAVCPWHRWACFSL